MFKRSQFRVSMPEMISSEVRNGLRNVNVFTLLEAGGLFPYLDHLFEEEVIPTLFGALKRVKIEEAEANS